MVGDGIRRRGHHCAHDAHPGGRAGRTAETLDILAQEGRATRTQQHHVFGGFKAADGAVVLYAGAQEDLVSLRVSAEAFEQLRATLSSR
jgi:hypothetical protein